MEVHAANRAVMLLKSVNQGPHAIVPELDRRRVEGNEDPWPSAGTVSVGRRNGGEAGAADRFGWNAIPFARDDFDSNLTWRQFVSNGSLIARPDDTRGAQMEPTLVSIPDEACILAERKDA